jgi:hypothetical protein
VQPVAVPVTIGVGDDPPIGAFSNDEGFVHCGLTGAVQEGAGLVVVVLDVLNHER